MSHLGKFIGAEASDPKAIFEIFKINRHSTPSYTIIGGSIAYALSIAAVDSASKALEYPVAKFTP